MLLVAWVRYKKGWNVLFDSSFDFFLFFFSFFFFSVAVFLHTGVCTTLFGSVGRG